MIISSPSSKGLCSIDADTTNPPLRYVSPITVNPPVIDAVAFIWNLKSGVNDAVTEPVAIKGCGGISSDNADRGILNKSLPEPENEPLNSGDTTLSLTNNEPVICGLPIIIVSFVTSYASTILNSPAIDEWSWQL